MSLPVAPIETTFAVLTVVAQLLLAVALVTLPFRRRLAALHTFVARHHLALGFVVAATGMAGSLFFSEVAHYEPCVLCWYQRICLYPVALIAGLALVTRGASVRASALGLAAVGTAIAGYQNYLIFTAPEVTSCGGDSGVSCTTEHFSAFGYVNLPIMALTAFVAVLMLFGPFGGRTPGQGPAPAHP